MLKSRRGKNTKFPRVQKFNGDCLKYVLLYDQRCGPCRNFYQMGLPKARLVVMNLRLVFENFMKVREGTLVL